MSHAYKVPLLNNPPEAGNSLSQDSHAQPTWATHLLHSAMEQDTACNCLCVPTCLAHACPAIVVQKSQSPSDPIAKLAIAVIVVACAGTLDSELQTPKKGGQVGPTAPIIQQDLAAHQPFGCLLLVAGGSKRHVGCPAHSLPYKKCRRFPDSLPACRLLRSSMRCRQLLVQSQSTQLQRCWECR